jgi:hypothetical protein
MRKLIPLIAGSLLFASPAFADPRGEAELERALAGRVAGEPVDCISLFGSNSSQVIENTAILYRVGGTIYVNRPRAGADSLDRDDTMVNRLFGDSRLCSIDTVRMVDLRTGFQTGIVFLGEFVPYRRVSSARN